jgi:peptidyl-prolyl cis-trans isomerase C
MTFKSARLLALVLATASLPVMAQTLVTVNGKPIPSSIADLIVKQQTEQATARGQKLPPDMRDQVKNRLVELNVLAQEAEKNGVAKSEDVKNEISLNRQEILANALLMDFVKKNPVKEETLKAEYERIKATMPKTEYHARHILVDKEEDAKALIVKLKNGAKFEDLAKENSKDGSASNGGDLDWGNTSTYVPAFSEAMVALKKGQFTETPVHTEFGYHIIKLEDTRDAHIPTFEELKPRLAQMVQQKQVEEYRKSLLAKAVVK